jgi:hypothetical protein
MSDECDRLFSSAKLTIVDRRGRFKADIIEACECLRAWYESPRLRITVIARMVRMITIGLIASSKIHFLSSFHYLSLVLGGLSAC